MVRHKIAAHFWIILFHVQLDFKKKKKKEKKKKK